MIRDGIRRCLVSSRSSAVRAYALMYLGITSGLCGCTPDKKAPVDGAPIKDTLWVPKEFTVDSNDPSVVYDTPFTMGSGAKTYNGKAYDKASLLIDPKMRLVYPDAATEVVFHDVPDAVVVYMEKRVQHYSHGRVDRWPVPEHRPNMGCVVKRENGDLVIGTFGEFSYLEGSVGLSLVIEVPHKLEVIPRPGLIGGMRGRDGSERPVGSINPAPGDPRPPLTKRGEGRLDLWLSPAVEDGWHEIPALADPQRRAAKKR